MRKLLTFASTVLLVSVVGCTHFNNSGCSSCGCGSGGCASAGCGSDNGGSHLRCTGGVCDCDLPPLTPYAKGLGLAPQPLVAAPAPAPVEQAVQAPREMPKASADTADK
jgi:hypothetical protein